MAISQPDLIKQCDFCFYALINLYHGKFPDLLKLLYVFPVYKAKDSLDKTNFFRLLQSWEKVLTTQDILAQCSWICQKPMSLLLMIYLLLNWKHTVSIKLVCIC